MVGLEPATVPVCSPELPMPRTRPASISLWITALALGACRAPAPTPPPESPPVPPLPAAALPAQATPAAAEAATPTDAPAPDLGPPLANFALPQRAEGGYAAVASAHPLATRAAMRAIHSGGSAADALVAASMMLTVVTPQSTGIGGGGFALVQPADGGKPTAWDFRETAPAAGRIGDYLDPQGRAIAERSRNHGLAVGVPGYVAGLWAVHQRYGRRPWSEMVLPAAEVAERGFAIGGRVAFAIAHIWPKLGRAERRVLGVGGQPLQKGQILRQPALARTLRLIAAKGPGGFYGGAVGAEIAAVVKARGGRMTPLDLTTYKPREVAPLRGKFFGRQALTMPRPSAGGAQILAMAELAEQFLRRLSRVNAHAAPDRPEVLHALLEAMRRSFVLRFAYSGDTPTPAATLDEVYPRAVRKRLARSFDPTRATPTAGLIIAGSTAMGQGRHTSHLSIVDRDGMAIASTHTINLLFGAGILVPAAGVWLNNELDDFSFNLQDANAFGLAGNTAGLFRPGARPQSSMTPLIVLEGGRPVLLAGAPGGTRIPTAVFLSAYWHLVAGMPLKAAVDRARVHHQALPDEAWVEEGPGHSATAAALESRGHAVVRKAPWCDVEAVRVQTREGGRRLEAVSDRRAEGGAMAM